MLFQVGVPGTTGLVAIVDRHLIRHQGYRCIVPGLLPA